MYVSWINSTSAYVSLHKRDQFGLILSKLVKRNSPYTLMTYKRRQAQLLLCADNGGGAQTQMSMQASPVPSGRNKRSANQKTSDSIRTTKNNKQSTTNFGSYVSSSYYWILLPILFVILSVVVLLILNVQ